MRPIRRRLVRDLHSGGQLDLFLVSAVASVLLIRFYHLVRRLRARLRHDALSQWEALVVLGFNLLVLLALGYMRAHEEGGN